MELSAVCVRRKESGDWGEDNLKHKVPVYIGMDELFGHAEEFDAVLIVVPHKSHPEYVRRACEHGKHIFCDKPAGVSVTDARNMSRWAKEAGVLYAMMFHCRALPKYMELKKIIDSESWESFFGSLRRHPCTEPAFIISPAAGEAAGTVRAVDF